MKPVVPRHLLLRQISAGHGGKGTPCALGETIRRLAFGRSSDDLLLVAVDPTEGIKPQELMVVVVAEFPGEATGVSPKLLKGVNRGAGQQALDAVDPDIFSSAVGEEEDKLKAQFTDEML